MTVRRICPACGETTPTHDASRCEACDYSFFGSSIGGRTIPSATSVQESIRQSISERAQQGGALAVRPAEMVHGGVRLALLADTSGSMTDDHKIESASAALGETLSGFPAEVAGQIDATVITFSERAGVRETMDSLPDICRRFKQLTASDCGGGTNIADGLKLAGEQVNLTRRTAERGRTYKVVILLSDGAHNQSGDPIRVSRSLKADRLLRVVCVGFGADMDRATLQAIASPGLFFEAHTGSALRDLYASFRDAVSSSITEGGDPGDYISNIV